MLAAIVPVIAWTSTIAFVICVFVGLASLVGLLKIDPWIQKWLVGVILAAIVGGIATSAPTLVNQIIQSFIDVKPTQPATAESAPPSTDVTAGETASPAPPKVPSVAANNEPAVPPVAQPAAPQAIDQGVKDWALNTLGDPPLAAVAIEAKYPSCVRDVAAMADSPTRDARAEDCVAVLRNFRSSQIATFYKAKATYDTKLDQQEKSLRRGPAAYWDFVVSEKTRFNRPETGEISQIGAIDQRSQADIQRCLKRKCLT